MSNKNGFKKPNFHTVTHMSLRFLCYTFTILISKTLHVQGSQLPLGPQKESLKNREKQKFLGN